MTARTQVEAEQTANERTLRQADMQAARERMPAPFDIAFLSNMENVTEVLLVRHGQQEMDITGPVSGLIDPPLSTLGREQARLVGAALSTERIDAVYASPLRRALDTAREIARHHRLEPAVTDDLREIGIFRDMPPDRTPLEFIGPQILAGARQRMIVACHGGVINAYVGHLIGSRYDMFFRPAHTSINIVAGGDGRRALYRLNDVHHLETPEGSFRSL